MSDHEIVKSILRSKDFDDNQFDMLDKYCIFLREHDKTHPGLQLQSMLFCLHIAIHTGRRNDYIDHHVREYVYTYLGHEYHPYEDFEDDANIFEKKKSIPEPKTGKVYIAHTDSMPNVIKIGYTTQEIEKRMEQLSPRTSVPIPFKCLWYKNVEDCTGAERDLHKRLKKYRIGETEFFEIDATEASVKCEKTLMEFGYVVR